MTQNYLTKDEMKEYIANERIFFARIVELPQYAETNNDAKEAKKHSEETLKNSAYGDLPVGEIANFLPRDDGYTYGYVEPKTKSKEAKDDFLIQKSGNIRNLELDFFGGEPLLNWNVVTETVKYARSLEKKYNKNFRFTLTTNGMLLNDEKIDFINKEIYDVVLSLDGRKETNDRFRIGKNKQGSYDLIVPKFQKLVSKRGSKQYYVRGTYTKKNLDFSAVPW